MTINKYYTDNLKDKNIIIYGNSKFSELFYHCLINDTPYSSKIKCFVVEKKLIKKKKIFNLPVISIEQFLKKYKPKKTLVVLTVGYLESNSIREKYFDFFNKKGYTFFSYLASNSIIQCDYKKFKSVHVFPNSTIQAFCKIGKNIIIRSNVSISHHNQIESNCFISNGVQTGGGVKIKRNSFIGIGSIISNDTTINPYNIIDSATVIRKNTKPNSTIRSFEKNIIKTIKKL